MLLERIYDEDLAQASYVVACQASGEALVVDPRRDVGTYLELAEHHGLRIVAVTETHVHADYLSGTRELAAATGAQVYVSGEGGEDWQYGFDGVRLHDGESVRLGNVTVTALHTPGHTPEHLSYLLTDGAVTDEPGYLLSGDFVFSGDLGRPDLLDEAMGAVDTRFAGAKEIYRSLQEKFLTLPDHVQVFPAHGSGSACGKALGALPSTTVGYERRFAWWAPSLAGDDEAGFVAEWLARPAGHDAADGLTAYDRDDESGLLTVTGAEPAEISRLLGEQGLWVDRLVPSRRGLEQIFLELTEGEGLA